MHNPNSYIIIVPMGHITGVVPKSETRGFDSWLTSSLRIECNFPLATSDVQMMSETNFIPRPQNKNTWYGVWYGVIK